MMLKIQTIRFALEICQYTVSWRGGSRKYGTSSLGKMYLPSLYAVSKSAICKVTLSRDVAAPPVK